MIIDATFYELLKIYRIIQKAYELKPLNLEIVMGIYWIGYG